jgi:uncharacterized RDD family membrane protein YckC
MHSDDRLELISPEGVVLDFTLGGLGSRFTAAVLDALLQFALIGALLVIAAVTGQGHGAFLGALAIVGLFVVLIGYHVAFEILNHGRTPGKRAMGLRVTNVDGRPVRFWQSMVRNVLRIVDIVPSTYLVGAVVILVTKKNQRVGDFVAGTLVVRSPRKTKLSDRPELALPIDHANWDVSGITSDDLVVIRRYLDRRDVFLPEARARLARELDERFRPKVAGATSLLSSDAFLEQLAAVKLNRS